ncbi:hypothetical protein ACE6H2_025941 [Prunus campanulata]
MASEIKVEVIHKETIKPSSPTPHHLRTSNLSVFISFNLKCMSLYFSSIPTVLGQ